MYRVKKVFPHGQVIQKNLAMAHRQNGDNVVILEVVVIIGVDVQVEEIKKDGGIPQLNLKVNFTVLIIYIID